MMFIWYEAAKVQIYLQTVMGNFFFMPFILQKENIFYLCTRK